MKKQYDKIYKKILWIPIALLIIAVIAAGAKFMATGSLVELSISLSGGTVISVVTDQELGLNQIQQDYLAEFEAEEVRARTITSQGQNQGYIIETDVLDDRLSAFSENYFSSQSVSIQTVEPTVSQQFVLQIVTAIFAAFAFMAVVVYFTYRSVVPSLTVILAVFTDLVVTVGIFDLLGQRLTVGGLAAFLMIIGYAVDTNILLCSAVLKQGHLSVNERIFGAAKTGVMMTATTIITLTLAMFLTNSPVISQIMLVLLIGLSVDVIFTWVANAGLLKMYVEAKKE